MAHAITHRHATAKVRVWSRASPCGACGGRNGTVAGLSPSNLVCPVNITLTILHAHFFIHH